jgi:drug/metabolite transporter (DMT)-like permease
VIGIALVLSIGGGMGKLGEISTDRLGLHALRNICHFTGQNLWFYALTVIPLGSLFALEFTSPLWVMLLAPIFLGERLTVLRVLAGIVGFIGVLLVARPDQMGLNPGVLAGAAAAIGFAGSLVFTKILTRTASITCILFWLTVIQAIFGLITAGYDFDIALPSAAMLPWVILIACAGLLAHLCITTAVSMAPATFVMPIDFARLPVVIVIGALFYDEPIDRLVILGGIIIFAANYLNIWVETRKSHA